MERRLGIMQSVEPVLENAIKTLQKVVDVRGMGKASLLQLNGDMDVNKEGLPIAPSWHVPVDDIKEWKPKDRPLTYNEKEKLTREDEDVYNGKQVDMHFQPLGHYDTDPNWEVTQKNRAEAEESAKAGAKSIRDGEIAAINSAKEANENLKKKKEETKEGKKAEKESADKEKKDMEKKETEDKKVKPDPEEKKDALMQIHGWEADESDSDSDDE